MLNEHRVRAIRYNAASDEVTLEVHGDGPNPRSPTARTVEGRLLLDAQGYLVGVDLGGDGPTVVMLGPHEKVDRTVDARLAVVHGKAGPDRVSIGGAKKAVRAAEKNPYL